MGIGDIMCFVQIEISQHPIMTEEITYLNLPVINKAIMLCTCLTLISKHLTDPLRLFQRIVTQFQKPQSTRGAFTYVRPQPLYASLQVTLPSINHACISHAYKCTTRSNPSIAT